MTSIIRGIVIDKRESKEACIWREEVVELRNITRISSDRRSDLPHGRANVAPLLHTWINKRDPVINIWIRWRKILIWNYTMFIHIFNVYLQLSNITCPYEMKHVYKNQYCYFSKYCIVNFCDIIWLPYVTTSWIKFRCDATRD